MDPILAAMIDHRSRQLLMNPTELNAHLLAALYRFDEMMKNQPSGRPRPVNCRCTLTPILAEE